MKTTRILYLSLILLIAIFAAVQSGVAQIPCGPTINPLPTLFVNWPQFHFDAAHSGCNPYEHILSRTTVSNLTWNWTYADPGGGTFTSPVVANGVVYAASSYGNQMSQYGYLYALNANTGAFLWRFAADWSVSASPAVANGIVYFGSAGSRIYALNALTGALIWQRGGEYLAAPTVAGGVVYAADVTGLVHAFDAATGNPIWATMVGNGIQSSPTLFNGVLYLGSQDGNVYALNAKTGVTLWTYPTGGPINSTPTVANNVVYIGSEDKNLYALNGTTGALVWKYATAGYVDSSPAVATGVVYVGNGCCNPSVYALNASTGALIWSYKTADEVHAPSVANGVVYFPGSNGFFYALDTRTGALLWSGTAGIGSYNSAAVADGVLYFGADLLYAFNLPSQ